MQIENSGVGRILRQLRWVLYPRRCPFCDRVLGSVSACPDCKEELETLRRRPTFRLARERHYIKNLEGAAAPYRYAGCVRRGVLRAKFQAAPWAADELGVEMARLLFGSKVRMRGFGPEVETVPGLAALSAFAGGKAGSTSAAEACIPAAEPLAGKAGKRKRCLRPHGGGTGRSQRFWRTVPPGARADGGSISSKNYLFDELTKNNRRNFMQKHLCPDGLWCMIKAMQCWIQQMRTESENRTQ